MKKPYKIKNAHIYKMKRSDHEQVLNLYTFLFASFSCFMFPVIMQK